MDFSLRFSGLRLHGFWTRKSFWLRSHADGGHLCWPFLPEVSLQAKAYAATVRVDAVATADKEPEGQITYGGSPLCFAGIRNLTVLNLGQRTSCRPFTPIGKSDAVSCWHGLRSDRVPG